MKNLSSADLCFWVDENDNEVDSGTVTQPGQPDYRNVIVPPGGHFDIKLLPAKKQTLLAAGFISEDGGTVKNQNPKQQPPQPTSKPTEQPPAPPPGSEKSKKTK
jgi:hypothetical protein